MGYIEYKERSIGPQELSKKLELLKRSHSEVVLHSVNALDTILDKVNVIRQALPCEEKSRWMELITQPSETTKIDEILEALNVIEVTIGKGLAALEAAMAETSIAFSNNANAAVI